MAPQMMTMQSNMCSDVISLLYTLHQSYFRSAGSIGADAFHECVELGLISAAVETVNGYMPVWCPTDLVNKNNGALPEWLLPISPGLAFYSGDDLNAMDDDGDDLPSEVPGVHLITSANAMAIVEHPLSYMDRFDIERSGSLIPTHTLTVLYGEGRFFSSYSIHTVCPTNVVYKSIRDQRPLKECCDHLPLYFPPPTGSGPREIRFSLFESCVKSISIPTNAFRQSGITELDLSFFYGARSLASPLDLSFLSCITAIGDDFLGDCSTLTEVDLTPLGKVTRLGERFMAGCSGIIELDVRPLHAVLLPGRPTPTDMLKGCTSLKRLVAVIGTTYPSLEVHTVVEFNE